MKDKLNPLGLNEMLDRLSDAACPLSNAFLACVMPLCSGVPNARINPPGNNHIVRQVLDERQAESGRVQ